MERQWDAVGSSKGPQTRGKKAGMGGAAVGRVGCSAAWPVAWQMGV